MKNPIRSRSIRLYFLAGVCGALGALRAILLVVRDHAVIDADGQNELLLG